MSFIDNLNRHFNAGVPIIQVVTNEETKLLNDLSSEYGDDNLIMWSLTQGFFKYGEIKQQPEGGDIVTALGSLFDNTQRITVFLDVDSFGDDVAVRRRIKDILPLLENEDKKYIFINKKYVDMTEIIDIPYDLPTVEKISAILDDVVESFSDGDEKKLAVENIIRDELITSAIGLTVFEIKNAFYLSVIEAGGFNSDTVRAVSKFKAEQLSKAGVLEFFEPDVNLQDVGGNKSLIEYIEKRKSLYSKDARSKNIPFPKGIILTGITGTGKSLTAKMIGSFFNVPLLRFNIGAVFGSLVGQSEERFRKATQQVEAIGRCVLWVDEIEKAFSGVKSGQVGSDVSPRLFGEFLTWLTERSGESYVVATCNDILKLPPEITNRSRFDEVFFIDLPNEDERKEVFNIHLNKHGCKVGDLTKSVKNSEGYTSSEIEQIVIDAMINSYYDDKKVSEYYLLESIKSIAPISKTMKDDIDELRRYSKNRFRMAAKLDAKAELVTKGFRKVKK